MNPYNFVSRKLSDTIECMVDELHCIIKINTTLLTMDGFDMGKKFNHYSVILYYAGVHLKEKSSLGFHSDCVYSPINGRSVTSSKYQVDNTPAVVYQICDSNSLHWKRIKIEVSNTGHSKWIDNPAFNSCYSLDSDTITTVNLLDQ